MTGTSYTPSTALPQGVAYWQVSASTDAGSLSSPVWELWVGADDALVDTSWGTTLDIHLDGEADLAISTIDYGSGMLQGQGAFWVILGQSGYPTAFMWTGSNMFSALGESVASAGDVNGDGYGDLLVTAQGENATLLYPGGPRFGLPPSVVLLPLANKVASAGDVNGDGYADILLALPAGGVDLYLGGPANPTLSTDLPVVGGQETSLGGADVNGDGYADVYVTGTGNDTYVYFGSATGLGTTPVVIVGTGATATDVNGDGYADLVVEASNTLAVYFGSASGLASSPVSVSPPTGATFGKLGTAGDVNLDGYGDVIIAGSVDAGAEEYAYVYLGGAEGLQDTPVTTMPNTPVTVLGSAGDFNGDGYADVFVGSGTAVSVYPGGATGVSTTSLFSIAIPEATAGFGTVY